ncbi:MAG: DMT family transporter [Desulfobacterales bacterium]|nr:DMT family transporter [Desulfobacterales bacterium]
MKTQPASPLIPLAAVIAAVFLWGASFSTMRMAMNQLDPSAVMFLRFAFALTALLPFLGRLWPRNYQAGDWKPLGILVLCQPCLYFLFESRALVYTTSSQVGLISACLPLMVALAARIILKETMKPLTLVGLFLSIAGVVGLTAFQAQGETAPHPILGNIMEILAMACACIYMIQIKQLSNRYNGWTLTAFQIITGTLFFSPGIQGILAAPAGTWTMELIATLAFLGVFVSLLAFGLYNYAMGLLPAARASIFINLIPVIAVFLGWLLLDETLNQIQSIAAAVVIFGVILSNRAQPA